MTDSENIASIRRKIAALLAKAKGTDNAAEAMAFAAKAQELLQRHNLSEREVGPDAPGRTPHKRGVGWRGTVAMAAAHLFDVKCYYEGGKVLTFAGAEGGRVTATLMYDYFVQMILRAKRAYLKQAKEEILTKLRSEAQSAYDRANEDFWLRYELKRRTKNSAFERGAAGELYRLAFAQHVSDGRLLVIAVESMPDDLRDPKRRTVKIGSAASDGRAAAAKIGLARQAMGGTKALGWAG